MLNLLSKGGYMQRTIFYLLMSLGLTPTVMATSPPNIQAPIKVLLLPAEIRIYQLTAANNLDEQPDASATANTQAIQDVQEFMLGPQKFIAVTMPSLTAAEQATLNEHLALYRVAASTAASVSRMGGPWTAPLADFDYTAGPGLRFLQTRTGASVALILIGNDAESSGGHIAMAALMSLFGVATPGGRNYMTAGLIDLNSGRIRWLDYDDNHAARDFTNPAVIKELVDEILQGYPQGSIHSDNGH
jgi:hypothetical protein